MIVGPSNSYTELLKVSTTTSCKDTEQKKPPACKKKTTPEGSKPSLNPYLPFLVRNCFKSLQMSPLCCPTSRYRLGLSKLVQVTWGFLRFRHFTMSSLIEGLAVAVNAIMGICKEMYNNIHDLSLSTFYTKNLKSLLIQNLNRHFNVFIIG